MGRLRHRQPRPGRGNETTGKGVGSFERMYLRLGDRLGESLEREMVSGVSLAPRSTLTRTCAVVIAVLVYLGALALAVGGAALIVIGRDATDSAATAPG